MKNWDDHETKTIDMVHLGYCNFVVTAILLERRR